MDKRLWYVPALAVDAAMLLLGLYEDDTVVQTYSAIALLLTALLLHSCREGVIDPRVPLFAAFMLAATSFALMYALNFDGAIYDTATYDPVTQEGEFSTGKKIYAHVEGIVIWLISYPLAYLATVCIAVLFGSRLNGYLAGGFLVFNSEAFTSLMLIALSVTNKDQLGESFFFVDELAYMFTGLVLSLIAGVAIVRSLRGRGFMVSREHLEVGD